MSVQRARSWARHATCYEVRSSGVDDDVARTKEIILFRLASLPLALALALGLSNSLGCARVEDRLNCRAVCNAYADCIDSDYDTRDCISRCSSDAADDDEFSRQVDVCETCIDDRSCGESVFACTTECARVVP